MSVFNILSRQETKPREAGQIALCRPDEKKGVVI